MILNAPMLYKTPLFLPVHPMLQTMAANAAWRVHINEAMVPQGDKWMCSLCHKIFTHRNAVRRHVKEIHYRVKNFACQYCARLVARKTELRLHENVCPVRRALVKSEQQAFTDDVRM